MKFWDVAQFSIDGLSDRKFRFILNLIGILIGCTAVSGLVSLTQGLSNDVSEQLEIFGPQNVIVIPGQIQQGHGIIGTSLGWKDLEIISKVPKVSMTTPIIANKYCQFNIKGKTYSSEVYGITHEWFFINKNTKIEHGRPLLRSDTATTVIGANIANPPEEDEPLLGVRDRIKIEVKIEDEIRTLTLRVVGILEKTGGGFGTNLDDSISIPLRTAQQLFDVGGEFDFIFAQAESMDLVDEVANGIKDKLGDSVTVITYESAIDMVGEVLGTIEAVLGGIAAISLIVAGVGIINTMAISVMERTREIGILKAIGAKNRDVLLMFLSEAMLTGLSGGLIGALLGGGLSQVIGNFINIQAAFSLSLTLFVVLFAITTGAISGLYPAWRASKLHPVEALRYE